MIVKRYSDVECTEDVRLIQTLSISVVVSLQHMELLRRRQVGCAWPRFTKRIRLAGWQVCLVDAKPEGDPQMDIGNSKLGRVGFSFIGRLVLLGEF